ncbi:MAG TPA: hypothetical protein VNW71_01775 [Thermoanaerobaculia bacterium]|nr:hypothetical protein [Thermoanaerobaculia bacterium]
MSRNSYRGLTLALVLIVSLGMALPAAAAGPDERVRARSGLVSWIRHWVGNLWPSAGGGDLKPAIARTGILIDPNGSQGGG